MMLVEPSRGLVDGMNDYAAHSGNFGSREAASQCVGQKRRPDAPALPLCINRQAADQEQRDLRGEAAPKSC